MSETSLQPLPEAAAAAFDPAHAAAVPTPATGVPAVDDLVLARAVASGDAVAFERLMRRHNRRLYRLARAALRDDAEAEDALQEAYLAAYRAIGNFRGDASLSTCCRAWC